MRKESLEGGTGFLFLPLELLRQSMILLLSEEIVLHNFKKKSFPWLAPKSDFIIVVTSEKERKGMGIKRGRQGLSTKTIMFNLLEI